MKSQPQTQTRRIKAWVQGPAQAPASQGAQASPDPLQNLEVAITQGHELVEVLQELLEDAEELLEALREAE